MNSRFLFFWRDGLELCPQDGRRVAQGVLGAAFFTTFGVSAFTFVMSLYAGEAGLSPTWLGLAFSGYFLARLVLAPLAGYGADVVGPMVLLLTASGLGALVPVLYFFYPFHEMLGVIQICLGFCAGIVKPVSMSLLGGCAPPEGRGRLFGAYNTSLYAALVLGPLAGGAAANSHGGMGWPLLALPGLGMALTFLIFLRSRSVSLAGTARGGEMGRKVSWKDPAFIALLLAVMGRTIGASVMVTFLPRLISEQFQTAGVVAGILFALPSLVIILGMPFTSRLADRLDRTGLTFLGMGVCAAGLFGFGQSSQLWTIACLAMIMGGGAALSLPASMSLVTDMGAAKGSVMGVFIGAANLGFVLGPSMAGFAAESGGGMAEAFEFTALLGGLCLLPLFLVMTKRLHVDR